MTSPRFRPERAWQRRDRVTGARRGSGRDGGAGRGWASPAVGVAAGAAARVGGSGRSRPQFVLLGVRVLLSQPRLLLCGQPLRLEERAAQVRGLRARAPARPEPAPPRGGAVGGAWANRGWGRAVRRWLWAPGTYCLLHRDHPAVIKRRFTSVLVVSSLSPLCVLLWRELTGIQPGTSLLTLMGFRLEGIFPAALLPLLLTMILFLGPLMQLSMDCPCDLADGLKVVLAPRSWARCLTDMRWLRNQVIAPLTEELVFRACMLPMLAPCTGLGPAVFTCPLFFGVAHFHHIFEQLRFRQSSVGSIFLSAAFQFSYTAVFGAYTAFLFIRTGKWPGRGRSWTEGLPAQPGPLTHSFKQRATAGLLGTAPRRPIGPEAETGWLRSAPGRAGSPGRRREGPAAGAEHGARPKAEPSRAPPRGSPAWGNGGGASPQTLPSPRRARACWGPST
ncbi:CAAX prenyl protease 2 isoform X3 [Physeter macrocephalus]|uniref:CAAX prenyl protease 2 n=1 Tax=Physeter macrocephalus TaxID=9755 RepID=A0A9W2X7S0_PHYMC|nr:CAAX prenyl protease 2 isoform X3 [Physeter catodon]